MLYTRRTWVIMAAAKSSALYFPEIRSAALRKILTLSSRGVASHDFRAVMAARMASLMIAWEVRQRRSRTMKNMDLWVSQRNIYWNGICHNMMKIQSNFNMIWKGIIQCLMLIAHNLSTRDHFLIQEMSCNILLSYVKSISNCRDYLCRPEMSLMWKLQSTKDYFLRSLACRRLQPPQLPAFDTLPAVNQTAGNLSASLGHPHNILYPEDMIWAMGNRGRYICYVEFPFLPATKCSPKCKIPTRFQQRKNVTQNVECKPWEGQIWREKKVGHDPEVGQWLHKCRNDYILNWSIVIDLSFLLPILNISIEQLKLLLQYLSTFMKRSLRAP